MVKFHVTKRYITTLPPHTRESKREVYEFDAETNLLTLYPEFASGEIEEMVVNIYDEVALKAAALMFTVE